jgi:arginine/ornithine N-succinyltransferase beta subunit
MTTNTPQVKIVNAETGIEIVRDANEVELAQMQKDAQEAILLEKAFEDRKAAKAQAEAKLAALGLTTDDLKALGIN